MKSVSEILEFIGKQIDSLEIEKGLHGKTERISARLSAYKEIKKFVEGYSHEQPSDKDKDVAGLINQIQLRDTEIEKLKGIISMMETQNFLSS